MEITAANIAEMVDGLVVGDPKIVVTGLATVFDAVCGDLVVAESQHYFDIAVKSECACILTGMDAFAETSKTIIQVKNPSQAFIKMLESFSGPDDSPALGIAPGAVIEDGAKLGADVAISHNCFVGSGAVIGNGCLLYPNVYIGRNVKIGDNTRIFPGVVIYANCIIGAGVRLHSGTVIGADGFGYRSCGKQGLEKYPHIGIVEIGDNVEVGANTTIDRAKTGSTVVGSGTKIDNLVHIAHNVKIGKNCVIIALSGIAGSVNIGDNVTLAAQSGVKDHVNIGNGSVVAGRAGVIGNIPDGVIVSGFPARNHSTEKRIEASKMHLPELLKRVKALEKEIASLRNENVEDRI